MKRVVSILIDGSGSMGRMESSEKYRGRFLVADKTRMDLTKVLLISEIVPAIDGADEIITQTFRADVKTKKIEYNFIQSCDYSLEQIKQGINCIRDPSEGGTPISKALEHTFEKLLSYVTYIAVSQTIHSFNYCKLL